MQPSNFRPAVDRQREYNCIYITTVMEKGNGYYGIITGCMYTYLLGFKRGLYREGVTTMKKNHVWGYTALIRENQMEKGGNPEIA